MKGMKGKLILLLTLHFMDHHNLEVVLGVAVSMGQN